MLLGLKKWLLGGGGGTPADESSGASLLSSRKVVVVSRAPSPPLSRHVKRHVHIDDAYRPYNIVMSGGSLKGVSFIGCVRRLEEMNALHGAKNLVGTSFGSLVLFMMALGCSSDDMMANLLSCIGQPSAAAELDPQQQQQQQQRRSHAKPPPALRVLLKCLECGGIDDGGVLLECIKRPLIAKLERSDITFIEFAKQTGKNLVVTGSNLSKKRPEFFSVDTTPDMSVVLALRISASIPFVFDPVVHDGSIYVDGALFNNFPIDWVASSMNRLDQRGETLAFLIDDAEDDDASAKVVIKAKVGVGQLISLFTESILSLLNNDDAKALASTEQQPQHVRVVRVLTRELRARVTSKMLGFSLESLKFEISAHDAAEAAAYGYELVAYDDVVASSTSYALDDDVTKTHQSS